MIRKMTLEEVWRTKMGTRLWLETHDQMNGDILKEVFRTVEFYDFYDYVTNFIDEENYVITCANILYGIEWWCWTEQSSETQIQEWKNE